MEVVPPRPNLAKVLIKVVRRLITQLDFFNKTRHIFSCDEAGLQLMYKPRLKLHFFVKLMQKRVVLDRHGCPSTPYRTPVYLHTALSNYDPLKLNFCYSPTTTNTVWDQQDCFRLPNPKRYLRVRSYCYKYV